MWQICHWCQRHWRQIFYHFPLCCWCRWQICRLCQWHRWQTKGIYNLTWTWRKKMYIYVHSTTQSCPNKIIKIFLIEDFFHLPPVSTTLVVHLELRISPRIFGKNRNGPNGILRALGETDSWKKTRSWKSRDTVPLRSLWITYRP